MLPPPPRANAPTGKATVVALVIASIESCHPLTLQQLSTAVADQQANVTGTMGFDFSGSIAASIFISSNAAPNAVANLRDCMLQSVPWLAFKVSSS